MVPPAGGNVASVVRHLIESRPLDRWPRLRVLAVGVERGKLGHQGTVPVVPPFFTPLRTQIARRGTYQSGRYRLSAKRAPQFAPASSLWDGHRAIVGLPEARAQKQSIALASDEALIYRVQRHLR